MTITIIITAIACLVVGGIAGALIVRSSHPEGKEKRELESKLQKAEDQLKAYQHEVTEHFIKTSGLVNDLTQSYKAVHEHLAASAMHLANPDISRQLLNAGAGQLAHTPEQNKTPAGEQVAPEPPRDYAPKVPGGILSEEYGLNDDYESQHSPESAVANDDEERPKQAV